jgi:hypothetical protein
MPVAHLVMAGAVAAAAHIQRARMSLSSPAKFILLLLVVEARRVWMARILHSPAQLLWQQAELGITTIVLVQAADNLRDARAM